MTTFRTFTLRGRRLLYTHGVYALTGFTALILILFKGVTDHLIPLYAIGAFLAFTLSQAGMVVHWLKMEEHPGRMWHMFVNAFGAVATGITLIVVLIAKFTAGAWVTALLVPMLIVIMLVIKRHYTRVKREMKDMTPLSLANLQEPLVVIPMARWDRISEKALRFGLLMSKDLKIVHVHSDDEPGGIEEEWEEKIMGPIRRENLAEPELIAIPSTYRFIVNPLMDYILELEEVEPGQKGRGASAGACGASLVGERSAQPACTAAEAVAVAQGQSAHRCRKYSLVPSSDGCGLDPHPSLVSVS